MTEEKMRAFHAVVEGKVQGVGFRAHTREAAARLGLTGWVRNLPEGTVEVWAEGTEAVLMELLNHLSEGPPWSHVANMDVDWSDAEGEHQKFRILR